MTVRQRLAGWAFTIGGKLDPDFDPWAQGEMRPSDAADAGPVIGFPLANAIKHRAGVYLGVDLATGRDRTVMTPNEPLVPASREVIEDGASGAHRKAAESLRVQRTSIHVPTGLRIHRAEDCHPPCAFHAPSRHPMVDWPIVMRATGLVERQCSHGVGHPDPDSVRYLEAFGPPGARGAWAMHGCDGCCSSLTRPIPPSPAFVPVVDRGPWPDRSQCALMPFDATARLAIHLAGGHTHPYTMHDVEWRVR